LLKYKQEYKTENLNQSSAKKNQQAGTMVKEEETCLRLLFRVSC